MKLYQAIAQNARILSKNNPIWQDAAEERQERILRLLPSGSGFDAGTKLISANDGKIVFTTEFHIWTKTGFMTDGLHIR